MTRSDDREMFIPFPRPFPMHAMQYVTDEDLNPAQRRQIVTLILDYFKQCARAEETLADGMIKTINNLDSKH
ncbi:MAG: hypothetical protein RB288_09895 [Bacteroidales bacterium]|jgi:hypothetical protein|nr:hypothetical protein [Bacteroidales bacterium]